MQYIILYNTKHGAPMNQIDQAFYHTLSFIDSLSTQQLFQYIQSQYLSLPPDIQTSLEKYFTKFSFWGKLCAKEEQWEEIHNRTTILKENTTYFQWLYQHLEDYSSKYLLLAILRNWLLYDYALLPKTQNTKYPHYFDLDILPHRKNDVFVDVGAYIGDTTMEYITQYGKDCYTTIYCYEITENSISTLVQQTQNFDNIIVKPKAVSNENGVAYFLPSQVDASANQTTEFSPYTIPCVTLDDDIPQPITLLKMDIEGDEFKALQGCQNHIQKDKPTLLISIYHGYQDYVRIPKYIYSLNKEYTFYLRNFGGGVFPTEIVLYAIAKQPAS